MVARVESFVFLVEVVDRVGTAHDLERHHLVEMLLGNLCQHLGNRRLEEGVVVVGVVSRDIAERFETKCRQPELRVPGVCNPPQIDRLDVEKQCPPEKRDADNWLDPLGKLLNAFLRNFRNPVFLFDSGRLRHDSPSFRWFGMCCYRATLARLYQRKHNIL